MKFTIDNGVEITAALNGEVCLRATRKGGFVLRLSFYVGEKLILESKTKAFLFYKRVSITYQDLNFINIKSIENVGLFGFKLLFRDSEISTKQNPFRKPAYTIYLDGQYIGEVKNEKGIRVFNKYFLDTISEDQGLNFYILFAFVLQLL